MAFRKTNEPLAFDPIVSPATSVKDNKVSIPLVFTKEKGEFHGFVPGIVMLDVVSKDLEICKQKLLETIKPILKNKISNNLPFPFVPSNEEIKKDFKDVVLIKTISIKVE